MKCPCCHSDDVTGIPHMSMICWNCRARMIQVNDTMKMTNCTCGRHDEGKMIKNRGESVHR
jgi:hypothetical protein